MRYTFLGIAIFGVLASWLVVAFGTARTNIEITDLWIGETAAARAVLHGTIVNRGVNGDHLLRLSFGVAERVAIFDLMGREVESLRIPADLELVLGVDTLHIEVVGLVRPIKAHESLPLLFVFQRAGKVTVNARVEVTQGVTQE